MRFLFLLLIQLIWLASHTTYAAGTPLNSREFIIDTDMAIDDAIAMLYLLKQPNIDVKAITIESNGNAHCKPAYANVLGILKLVNQSGIPIACGRETPLFGNHHFPASVINECDTLGGAAFPPTDNISSQSAKALMIKTLKQSKAPVDILAIAPLTTIAEVITEEPELKSKIRMIYLMGGAIRVPGNIKDIDKNNENTSAEWNIYIDPLAAHQVFASNIPITLIPLDATNQVPMTAEFLDQLKANHASPAANFVYQALEKNKTLLGQGLYYFWDPMAAVIASDESLASIETERLSILLHPDEKSGTTIENKNRGRPVRVCRAIDVAKFKAALINGLNRT